MELIRASKDHFSIVEEIVKSTIITVYPNYYPQGAVDFFLDHHSNIAVQKAIIDEKVYLIKTDNDFVGTGSIDKNEIKRLFILPKYQGKGYGTSIMNKLEKDVFDSYSEIYIDASLPAHDMYIYRGYIPVEYHKIKTENGHYLCYYSMKKSNNALCSGR